MVTHEFLPHPWGKDLCDRQVEEDGRVRTCCAPLRDHGRPRLPEAWLIDAAGTSVRFCRLAETLTFTAQTARALAAALLRAADEAGDAP